MDKYKVIRKVRKNGSSLAINIPKEIVEILKIKEGESVEVEIKKLQE